MRVTEIRTQSFRNLSPGPVFFGAGVTVIVGENAQGKTNLLEAVALLCGQRSFRRARPAEMAGQPGGFRITGVICRSGGTESLSIAWSPGEGRRFARGEKAISFREASVLAPAVFLSPEHRELITGPPALRRRFLDRLVLGSRPAAGGDLLCYERALAERNALLSMMRAGSRATDELDAWTEELVRAGVAVRRHRRRALEDWLTIFRPLAGQAGPRYAPIRVDYLAEAETEEGLRAALAKKLAIERRRGHTLCGPHRDDLSWTRNGRPLAGQASAGELARVAALAKLAEWHTVSAACGEAPLFGVDEFDAGLSEAWVEAFWKELPPAGTVLLTTASPSSRWRQRAAGVLEMRAGRVLERPRAVND